MAEDMKNALKGQGGGLQGASSAIGNMMAGETQSGGQKKSQAASDSLNQMASGVKGSGDTVGGTNMSAQDQIANQSTGAADHLGMKFKK